MSLFPSFIQVDPGPLIAQAGNTVTGGNPAYAETDFLGFYPQFTGLVPDPVLTSFIAQASAKVSMNRWHDDWTFGMAELIAHYCVLYLTKAGGANPTAASVVSAAQPKGIQTSKSVGSVSVGYDAITDEFKGWGDLGLTSYGRSFITLAKPLFRAGIYVQ